MWTINHIGKWESPTFYFASTPEEEDAIQDAAVAMRCVDSSAGVNSHNAHKRFFECDNPPDSRMLEAWEQFLRVYPA